MNFEFKIPFICFHKYEESEGVIFCDKCGKIKKLPCNHIWENIDTTYVGTKRNDEGKRIGWSRRFQHLGCTKCGNIKKVED